MSEQTDTQPTVNPLGFSEWSSETNFDDPLESRVKYGDYLREQYINADAYTPTVEKEISIAFAQSLQQEGLLTEENASDVERRISAIQGAVSFDQEARNMHRSLSSTEDAQTLSDYLSAADVDAPSPEYLEELQPLKDKATEIVNNEKDARARAMIDAGEIPMAKLSSGELLVGEATERMGLVAAIKSSKAGGVTMADAMAAKAQLSTPDGWEIPLYKIKKLTEIYRLLEVEQKEDEDFSLIVDGLSTELAESEYDAGDRREKWFDEMGRKGVNLIRRVLGQGEDVDKENARRRAIEEARGTNIRQLAAKYALKFDQRPEEVEMALKQLSLDNANSKQMFEFHDEDDEIGKNIRFLGYGLPSVSPQALVNKDVFDKAIAAHPDMSQNVKDALERQRVNYLQERFVDYNKLLSRTSVADEWNKALITGRATGVEDYRILEAFVADEDNYNEFKERLSGLGASIWHGFGQVIHAIPASLGAQVSKDYLASVAQKNSDRRQLAEVFGEEFGFLQDVGETAFPMLMDVGITGLLALKTIPAGGAGAVAYASMKAGGRASASLAGKGVTKALFSSVFRRKAGKSITEQADELLGEGLIKGTRSGAVDILKTYNGKLASKLGIAPAVFIPAATRSGSATYGAVYNQLRQNPDITEEEAHDRALGSMLLAGTFTGILTSAFSVIGKGGLEDALLKGLTYKQMNTVAKSVTNMVEGDLLEVAEKAISETMKKYAFGGAKGLMRNFRDEGIEEGIDEFVNGLVTDAALNENTPFLERLQQSWHAVVLGGTMGAGVPVAQFALRPLKPAAASGAQMGGMFDEVLESMARDLTDKGAPITAEVLSAIASDTRRKDARLSVVPTPEEQQDILEEQSKQRLLRGAKERDEGDVPLASGITSGEKFRQELEASVNPDSVAEAVAETLASSVPVVSGADPNTVETKGSLMRSLGMQVREASSVENTDHQSVRDLLIPPVAGTEPDYFEGARPLARQLILDPARQSEVDAIEAYYTERIEKVNEAEAFYNKMDREAQSFEMAAGAESPVRKGLRRAVREGKAISSKDAAELRGLVFKDRILALRKLKIEQSVEQETQDLQELSEPVESSVNFLINSGFQHIVTIPKLKRLGIPVNQRTTSEPFLRAVNRRIAREVEEKFPKLKITKPANGAAIKSVYGQGQVFVDQNQVGQFDNDPVAMLTLLELGTPIVVSEEALASPTLNPAFRFTQVGETTVVSNIMVPESRGLVSALTPAERALNIRPDYTSLSELVNTVTSLRRQGIQNPNDLISSPFNPDEKITVEEAMSRLEQSADVTEFLQPTRRGLTEPFVATAAIELRLRAQEALFRGDTVSLEGLGNQVANRYQQEQEARLKHQKEVFMSTVSPENAAELQADPDFNPESEISDTYTAYPEEDPVLFSPSELSGLFKDAQSNAVAAITGDQELRTRVVNLVQNEVFGSTTIDFDRVSNKTLWGYLVQWMAQGNSRSNPASIEFQKELKGNRFDMGRPVRDTLRMMTLSSNSIEGTIQDNAEYRAFLKDQIRSLRGVEATDGQVTEFFNFIRQSIGELQLRSQPTAMSLAEVQRVNLEAIAALGLKSGESSSIIEALRRIAGVSARTQKKYDKNLVALARLLLKSPDFINTIELTIDETNQNYAGNFDILNDGTPAISINISGHNPRGVADTLLHELTHAFVTNVTRKSPAQQTRQEANAIGVLEQTVRGIRERLNVRGPQLAKIGYTNNDPRVLDGLENVDEFVAHFLTSTDFQAVVKVISDQQNNFFQRAINAIVAFFNPTRTEIPQFTEIFSSVLDLSQAAIVAAGPRKKKASISMDEFVALQDEGKVNSESLSTTAADYIADKVFPATPATDSTVRKEPVTANALANKVAHDIIESQQEQVRLASNVQAATGVDPAAQQEIVARIEETISYVEGLVSPETQIEVNNELPVMAEVDPKTGVLTINPLKLAGLGLDLQQRNGGRPVPAHTRRHILAVVINEEVAHAASVSALTTTEIQEIMDSMTLADAYRAIDAYGDTSENAAKTRESMKMGWRTGDPAVRQQVVEEMLRQHAQRVTRGFTTEEDVAFLRTNPNLLQYIIRYFKSFLKKLGYYRSRGDISPQLRVAVDRMVNEIRAMESGFRVHSNFAPFDANNPASAVEKFRKQIRMNKPIERPDAGEPALASGIGSGQEAAAFLREQGITGVENLADFGYGYFLSDGTEGLAPVKTEEEAIAEADQTGKSEVFRISRNIIGEGEVVQKGLRRYVKVGDEMFSLFLNVDNGTPHFGAVRKVKLRTTGEMVWATGSEFELTGTGTPFRVMRELSAPFFQMLQIADAEKPGMRFRLDAEPRRAKLFKRFLERAGIGLDQSNQFTLSGDYHSGELGQGNLAALGLASGITAPITLPLFSVQEGDAEFAAIMEKEGPSRSSSFEPRRDESGQFRKMPLGRVIDLIPSDTKSGHLQALLILRDSLNPSARKSFEETEVRWGTKDGEMRILDSMGNSHYGKTTLGGTRYIHLAADSRDSHPYVSDEAWAWNAPARVWGGVLLHEAAHAATVVALDKHAGPRGWGRGGLESWSKDRGDFTDPNAVANAPAAIRDLFRLYHRVKPQVDATVGTAGDYDRSLGYAVSNIHEFIADAWSNSEFQTYLRGISVSPDKSAFQEFIDIIKRLILGDEASESANTALEEVLDLSIQIANLGKPDPNWKVVTGRIASGITADAVSLSPIDAPLDLSGIGVTAGSRVNTAQGSEAEDSTFEAYEQQDSYVINSVSVAKYVAFQGRKNLRGRPTQVRGKDTLIYKQLKALDDRRVEMFPNTELKATVIREINSASRVSDALVKRIAQMLYVGEVEFTGTEAQMTNVRGLIDFVRGRDKTTVNAAKEWKAQTVRGVLDEMRPLADEVYDTVNAFAVDNLVHLYDSMHPVLRERAKLWYEGANRIAQDLAERYNLTLEQASTALAVLSPQKDWFQNVSLAGRVMEVVTKNKRKKYTQTMADRALQMAENATKSSDETMAEFQKRKKRGIHETKKFNEMMVGKTLGQLIKQAKEGTESETLPARYVRVFDQINHPRGYAIISPEGNRLGLQTTKNNTVAAVGWGSYKEIQKAVNALLTTDEAIHSDLLGEQHKVRNFRNNIADPANADDGTIDTHAVSALYFIPVAGADTEVAHNFASSKGEDKISSDGSIQFGINGTYALNLKAHQDAAAFINERDGTNLSTREIQSITWEQIRTLFQPEQKREKASYAKKGDKETVLDESRQIWDKTTDDGEARQLIEERFGGYGFPDWATPRELRSVAEDVAYSERVRLKRLPSGAVSRLPDTDASGDSDGVGSVGVTGLKSGVWSPAVNARDISSDEAVELLSEIRLDGTKESSRERFLAAVTSANKSLDNFELEGASIFLAEDNSAGVAVSPVTELGGGDLFVFDSREDHKNVIGILELLQAATSQRALLDSSGDTIQVATVKVKDIDNLPNIMHQTFGFAPYSRVLSEDGSETVFMGRDSFDGFYNPVLHPYEHYRGTQPVFESEELAKAHRTRRMASMGISLEREPMTTREKIFRQTEQDEPSVTLGDIIKGLPATLVSPIAGEAPTNLFGTRIKENARLRINAKALARIREEKARIAKEEPRFRKEGAFDKEELPERLRETDLPTFLGVRGISELSLRSGVQVESAKILTLDELRGLDDSVNEAVQTIETTQGRPLDEGQRASIMSGIFGAVSDLPSEFNDAGVDYSEFIELLELPLIEKGVGFDKIGGTFKKLFFGETDPTVQRFARQRDAFLRTGDKMVEEYHLKYKEAIEKDYDPDNIPWETIQTATGTTDNIDPDPDGTIADARDKAKIDIQRKYATELSDKINKIEDAYDNARANIKATEPDAGKRRQLYTEERKKKDAAITRETELNKAARGAEEELADTTYKADLKKAFAARKDKMMRDRDAALKQIQVESPDLFNVLLDLRRLTDELSVQARDLFGRHDKGVLVKFDNNLGLYVTRRYRMFSETDYVDRILRSDEEADVAIRAAAIDFMHGQFIENETRRQIAANPSISESDARAEAERVYNSRELGGQSLGYQMITEFLLSYDTETGPEDFASAFALAGMPKTKEPRSTGALRAIVKNLQGRAEIPKPLADLMGANNIPEESVDNLLYAFATVAKIASHQHFLESMRQQGIANGWLFTKEQYNDLLKEPDGYAKHAHRFRQIQNSGADSGLNPLAGLYVENDIYESILPMFQQTTRAGNDAASTVMSTSLAAAQRLTGAAMAAKTLFSLGFYLRNALGNVLFFGPAQGYFHSAKDIISGDPMSGTGMNMFSAIGRAVQGNKAETSAYLRSLEGLDVFGNEVRSEIMIRLLRGEETTDGVQAQLSDLASKASNKKTPAHIRRAAADTMARLAGAMDTFYKIGYFEHELAVLRKAYKADLAEGKISEIDLKREAAEIVGDTAQSYSRALPIIKKFTGSGAGLLIAPFVRFTAEVPRIAVNTIKRGVKEMRSDNPVIKARGFRRLAGFSIVVGGLSMAVPTLLRVVLSGMGEEEDEAFRMSLPPYLRNHTFFIQKLDNGDIKSWDLTYLNPFSVIADPMLRTLEHSVRGEPLTAVTKLLTSSFVDPYLGDQIFAGAVFDIKENRNARDDNPIWEETDTPALKLGKMIGYLTKEAYGPRTPLKLKDAYLALGQDQQSFDNSPFGIIFNEAMPVVPKTTPPVDMFRRVVFKMRDEQTRVQRRFGELRKTAGMSEGQVARVHRDIRKSRMRINSQLSRAMKGFRGMGVSNNEMYQTMKGARYGKRRSQLLFTGFMENPVPPKNLVDALMSTEVGRERLRALMEEHANHARFLRLDDD